MIKKTLLAFILLLVFPAAAMSSPAALYCDYQDGVDLVDVEVTTVSTGDILIYSGLTPVHVPETDEFRLMEVGNLDPGQYHFRARFVGKGGFPGEWSVPLNATKPGSPSNVRVK